MIINATGSITISYADTQFVYGESHNVITSFPVTLINANATAGHFVVYLDFSGAISIVEENFFFIMGSDNILIDGQNIPMTIGISNFGGLLKNGGGEDNSYRYTDVRNIIMYGTEYLSAGGGWIFRKDFKFCNVTNCSVYANIGNGGGIFGSNCSDCTATQCSTNGYIDDGGGIFGSNCSDCTATQCSTNGYIDDGGGIFGKYCNRCDAISCYSNGEIQYSGGIFGQSCVSCSATLCFSLGNMFSDSGGIFGTNTNKDSSGQTCTATKCYSVGLIGGTFESGAYACGGIFGPYSNRNSTSSTCEAINCFSCGNLFGFALENAGCGGIFGTNCNPTATNCVCLADRCFSTGLIGEACGGIFHQGWGTIEARDCYSIGNIEDSGGGIVGQAADSAIITNCYSVGNIGENAGGIIGNNCNNADIFGCYSIGLLAENAGGIIVTSSGSVVRNCYTTSSRISASGDSDLTIINSISEDGTWDDDNADFTLGFSGEAHWISPDTNSPFLLSGFTEMLNVPKGLQYIYTLGATQTVVDGAILLATLIGYYAEETETTIHPNIYGYSIKNRSLNVTASSSGTTYTNTSHAVTYRRYRPIWTCTTESFKL